MTTVYELVLDSSSRKPAWVVFVDLTLPVVPVLWALVDLVAVGIARLVARRDSLSPEYGAA